MFRELPPEFLFKPRANGLPIPSVRFSASARPETVQRIGSRLLEHVALRIDLAPWTEGETCAYLDTSISKAGRVQPAFDQSAVRRLFELSGGAPSKNENLSYRKFQARAYRVSTAAGRTVKELEETIGRRTVVGIGDARESFAMTSKQSFGSLTPALRQSPYAGAVAWATL